MARAKAALVPLMSFRGNKVTANLLTQEYVKRSLGPMTWTWQSHASLGTLKSGGVCATEAPDFSISAARFRAAIVIASAAVEPIN